MTRLVDVVNFNADASCLPSREWLAILEGGADSRLCRWLRLYVRHERRVVLGFVGGAIADIATFNPEAIALINAHPGVFESILRPFSHDVGLLRSAPGFRTNVALGSEIVRREFDRVVDYFLPPEFMLTSAQVKVLADTGIRGIFINPSRFKDEIRQRLPTLPYWLSGVLGAQLPCIPFRGELTEHYLDSLHAFDARPWIAAVAESGREREFVWRDGESSFLVPDGIAREDAWLSQEAAAGVQREFLSDAVGGMRYLSDEDLPANAFRAYPVHSFSAWFKEFRMLGYLSRLERLESGLESMPRGQLVVWLQAINSDILSAVEKDSPVVTLRDRAGDEAVETAFTIWRSERGFEGEDYLALLESLVADPERKDSVPESGQAHFVKLRARADYVRRFLPARSA
jgi:hypothetical protein